MVGVLAGISEVCEGTLDGVKDSYKEWMAGNQFLKDLHPTDSPQNARLASRRCTYSLGSLMQRPVCIHCRSLSVPYDQGRPSLRLSQ